MIEILARVPGMTARGRRARNRQPFAAPRRGMEPVAFRTEGRRRGAPASRGRPVRLPFSVKASAGCGWRSGRYATMSTSSSRSTFNNSSRIDDRETLVELLAINGDVWVLRRAAVRAWRAEPHCSGCLLESGDLASQLFGLFLEFGGLALEVGDGARPVRLSAGGVVFLWFVGCLLERLDGLFENLRG